MLLVFVLLAILMVGAGWRVRHLVRERETANPPRTVEVRPFCAPESSTPGVSAAIFTSRGEFGDEARIARIQALTTEIQAVANARRRADAEFNAALRAARP